ncbi:uncharacterized protein [Engystomops pustulosus]|uniref:uncharacterized protein n=1 Tax=Engystomops pustulosus TaxID=76066 RepID=UPI003AFB399E
MGDNLKCRDPLLPSLGIGPSSPHQGPHTLDPDVGSPTSYSGLSSPTSDVFPRDQSSTRYSRSSKEPEEPTWLIMDQRSRMAESDFTPRRRLRSSRQRLPAPDDDNSVPRTDRRSRRRGRQQGTERSRSPLRREGAPGSSGAISSAVPAPSSPNSIRQRTNQRSEGRPTQRHRGQQHSRSPSRQESELARRRRQPRSRSPRQTHHETGSHRRQVDRVRSRSPHHTHPESARHRRQVDRVPIRSPPRLEPDAAAPLELEVPATPELEAPAPPESEAPEPPVPEAAPRPSEPGTLALPEPEAPIPPEPEASTGPSVAISSAVPGPVVSSVPNEPARQENEGPTTSGITTTQRPQNRRPRRGRAGRLERLQMMNYTLTDDANSSCIICMEDFVAQERVAKLPCSHLFHYDCIIRWIGENVSCPICRAPV